MEHVVAAPVERPVERRCARGGSGEDGKAKSGDDDEPAHDNLPTNWNPAAMIGPPGEACLKRC
jgi:hypothetical protein